MAQIKEKAYQCWHAFSARVLEDGPQVYYIFTEKKECPAYFQ